MKKYLGLILGGFIVVVVICILWIQSALLPINSQDKSQHVFVVTPGTGVHQVADDLASEGFIRNAFIFRAYMFFTGLSGNVQKGDFKISSSMSAQQIARLITQKPLDVWITVIPGKRADEIADILQKQIPSFQDDWRAQLRLHEGYLYPDTYLIPRDTTIDQIISIMTNNFDKKWQEALPQQANKLTEEQAVIIASILQREAPSGEDMRKVASVLENRLSIGMALQVDATVQYALGYQSNGQTWWKKNLTPQDLKIDSPYNTYANPGLPPTPISSPDLEALKATLNPADTNYIYYISDAHGVMHYATTLQEHNANIRKYGL